MELITINTKNSICLMNRFQMNINGKDLSWIAEKSPLGLAIICSTTLIAKLTKGFLTEMDRFSKDFVKVLIRWLPADYEDE